MAPARLADAVRPAAYAALNIASASGIVFANKAVMSTFGFTFVYALTLIHTLVTWAGLALFRKCGAAEGGKRIARRHLLTLSASFVGYVVLCNLNLRINPIGFYQVRAPLRVGCSQRSVVCCWAAAPICPGGSAMNCSTLTLPLQISKIAVAPAVLALQAVLYGQRASARVIASILLVCAGVGLATVTDPQVCEASWACLPARIQG